MTKDQQRREVLRVRRWLSKEIKTAREDETLSPGERQVLIEDLRADAQRMVDKACSPPRPFEDRWY